MFEFDCILANSSWADIHAPLYTTTHQIHPLNLAAYLNHPNPQLSLCLLMCIALVPWSLNFKHVTCLKFSLQ